MNPVRIKKKHTRYEFWVINIRIKRVMIGNHFLFLIEQAQQQVFYLLILQKQKNYTNMLKLKLGKIPCFTLKEKTQGDSHFTKKIPQSYTFQCAPCIYNTPHYP